MPTAKWFNTPLLLNSLHIIDYRKEGYFMGYYGNVGGINNGCCYGGGTGGYGSSFALIVVLFILLIIIGATFMNRGY